MTEYRDIEHAGAWRYDDPDVLCPVLVVGEDNPLSSNPRDALYPYPIGCAGHNYAENIANVGMGHHLATWRTNLCAVRWGAKEARARARALVVTPGVPWRVIIMLGRKVADAFRYVNPTTSIPTVEKFEPFGAAVRILHRINPAPSTTEADLDWITLISLPHPSGRNRVWNDAAIFRARALLASVAPTWYGECNT